MLEDRIGFVVGQNLDGVGNQETRPSQGVSDTMQPDKDNVDIANCKGTFLGILLTSDGSANQEQEHTTGAIVN